MFSFETNEHWCCIIFKIFIDFILCFSCRNCYRKCRGRPWSTNYFIGQENAFMCTKRDSWIFRQYKFQCNIKLIYLCATFVYTVIYLFIMVDILIVFKWQLLFIFIKAKNKWFSSFNSSKRKCNGFLWIHRLSGNAAITHYMIYKKEIDRHNYFTSTHLSLNHSAFMLAFPAFCSRWLVWNCRYQYCLSALFRKKIFFINHILFVLQIIYIELYINV